MSKVSSTTQYLPAIARSLTHAGRRILVHDHERIAVLLLREEGEGENVLAVIVPDLLARRVSVDRSAGLSAKS
jgi:hypothetical protein